MPPSASPLGLHAGQLSAEAGTVFSGVGGECSLEPASYGAFLRVRAEAPFARRRVKLGDVPALTRYMACFRDEPFWMKPKTGRALSEVPIDTQFLLLELASGTKVLLAPLVDAPFKATLEGKAHGLELVLDTGDPNLLANEALALYVALGTDVHELCRLGAEEVAHRLGTVRLRVQKPLPAFVDDFGWCTWDAFYRDVSEELVLSGLETFRDGGVMPRLLVLDDGWQTVRENPAEPRGARLAGFAANEKFEGGLSALVTQAKQAFGVRSFVVWHAVHGYWGGIDAGAFADYGVENRLRWYSPEVLAHQPAFNQDWWGAEVGRPAGARLPAFFDDYHRYLAAQGVDGVKVDNQASIEALGVGEGGRVGYMLATRRALEQSVRRHFGGALVNCMSCSSEMFYACEDSSLTRTSTDFWPNLPASHGEHVYTNALVGLWFGEFVHPDWDMFQSGHAAGSFHAAARAVSGGPVYVSDQPGKQDFELLRQLVDSDGRILRAAGVGKPVASSVFEDPLSRPVLLKIANHNPCTQLIGIFNARYREADDAINGDVSALDLPLIPGISPAETSDFALYLGRADRLLRVTRDQRISLTLPSLGWELATFARLERGVAALGLRDKLNGGAAVLASAWTGDDFVAMFSDGGEYLFYSAHAPSAVLIDGVDSAFRFEAGRLSVTVVAPGAHEARLRFAVGAAI